MTQANPSPSLKPLEPAKKRAARARWPLWLGLGAIVGVTAYLGANSLGNNLVFYVLPSEYQQKAADFEGRTLQLGGLVKKGSVKYNPQTLELNFVATDGTVSYPVNYRGTVPDLFKEDTIVLVEGRMNAGRFEGSRLLIKHSEEYKAATPGQGPGNLRQYIDQTLKSGG